MSRRLIVNADDFGRSRSINEAVIRAHREGILTTASLMVTGEAFEEAVALARENPRLGVGLHLTLVCGTPAVGRDVNPRLVRENGLLDDNAPRAGMRFFFDRRLELEIEREMEAQFERFHSTGLALDHVNGHLNIHLHPTVLRLLFRSSARWGIRAMRWTHDPLLTSLSLGKGRWFYRLSHAMAFGCLTRWSRAGFDRAGLKRTGQVYGLLENALVDERYVTALLEELPDGESELYSHPSLDEFKHEFEALLSPRVREVIHRKGIQLIRYSDL